MPSILSKQTESKTYAGWVYVLRCKFHKKSIIKIGFTTEIDLCRRVTQLSRATESPGKFVVIMAVWIADAKEFESHLHFMFASKRLPRKDPGSSAQPEFFKIPQKSVEWKMLVAAFSREMQRGGIEYSNEHGEYSSVELFGRFKKTNNNKKKLRRDANPKSSVEPVEYSLHDTEPEQDIHSNIELVETFVNDVLFYIDTNGNWYDSEFNPVSNQTPEDDLTQLANSIESYELASSNDSLSYESKSDEEDKKCRGANKPYNLNKLQDGAIVATPERLQWSSDPNVRGTVYSMQAKYKTRTGKLQCLETAREFSDLAEMCKEFVTRLGWDNAIRDLDNGNPRTFKHSPNGPPVEHKRNNNHIAWNTMYLIEKNQKTPLTHIIL
jgi:hypothetical protein